MRNRRLKLTAAILAMFLSIAVSCSISSYNIIARPGNGHLSGSSHHSSSWGSSSSRSYHSNSGWGHSSRSYGYGTHSFFGGIGIGTIIFIIIIIAIIWYVSSKNRRNNSYDNNNFNNYSNNNFNNNYQPNDFQENYETRKSEAEIQSELNKIMQKDLLFYKEDFISKVNEMFMFIYSAWEKRDLNLLRAYETDSLFNLHRGMINEYIQNKQINMLDNICIRKIRIIDANSAPSYDSITVKVTATLNDYTIDEETQRVVNGSKTQISEFIEIWTFIRKGNVQTKQEHKVNQCPNCGAPLDINSEGECSYCRTVVTKGDYGWVLSNIEQVD